MGSAVERTDEHVREYLIYRGFTNTLRHLDSEIKADKEKGFRVSLSQNSHVLFGPLSLLYPVPLLLLLLILLCLHSPFATFHPPIYDFYSNY